jgi:hypothetical protein
VKSLAGGSLAGGSLAGKSLSGRELAADIRAGTAAQAAGLTAAGRPPRLAVVTVTADEASAWYVRSLATAAAKVGIGCDVIDLIPAIADAPENAAASVEAALAELSGRRSRRACGWPSWRRPSTGARTSTARTRPRSAAL